MISSYIYQIEISKINKLLNLMETYRKQKKIKKLYSNKVKL